MELSDRSMLSVFLSGDVPCVNLVNSIARHNGRVITKYLPSKVLKYLLLIM
jgi:hypothetical protein